MPEKRDLKLDISMYIYLKEQFTNVFESKINANSFKEAHEMLDKAERFMSLEYEKYEDK
jgi:hypothetical protein